MAEAIGRMAGVPTPTPETARVKSLVIRSESMLTPNKKYIQPCSVTYPPKFRFETPDFQKNAEKDETVSNREKIQGKPIITLCDCRVIADTGGRSHPRADTPTG
jgi:hypothetical protein